MAQRIATEYVSASLQLTAEEMAGFVRFFEDQHVKHQVRVLDNGNHEMVLEDDAGREEVRLTFERQQDRFVSLLSCRIMHPKLTNAMRKAVAAFRGDAIVNRIYPTYTMTYHYVQGNVRKIVEHKNNEARVIFEFKDTIGQLEAAFRVMDIEHEIQVVQGAIDQLLDLRNQCSDRAQIALIDERLTSYTRQLFMMEA
ncbi:non-ribosomal peptide synthetase module [Paenibacillus sp. MWE-103]|uniref:Non-ribosomal peptide synthetase module n=1 Tax=Paenibacillus artemisiicola TaxID=1172618 RepID=A0ABS3WAZ2_9BACL|nr:non-ribosomal peptide synthetase module [Paenibacillus artemisiicola]MBO7745463.1 non-ribosomal peptide synthetase module [Paenibacillus artemisiicola]